MNSYSFSSAVTCIMYPEFIMATGYQFFHESTDRTLMSGVLESGDALQPPCTGVL